MLIGIRIHSGVRSSTLALFLLRRYKLSQPHQASQREQIRDGSDKMPVSETHRGWLFHHHGARLGIKSRQIGP